MSYLCYLGTKSLNIFDIVTTCFLRYDEIMNDERVSLVDIGKTPVLVVAPHAYEFDDEQTGVIVTEIAQLTKGYAIINNGWKRSDQVDIFNDKADCNDVRHVHEDVVKQEFLDPIIRFKNRILREHPMVLMFLIHGMANRHRIIAGDSQMQMVIGCGNGNPPSYSCEPWRKDVLMHLLIQSGFHPYEGSKGGPMSGWARNNMNQLFRKWYNDQRVQSCQIEVIHELREDNDTAKLTASYLADAILSALNISSFNTSATFKSY